MDFTEDALIISGDVSHDMKRLQRTLSRFARDLPMSFVPEITSCGSDKTIPEIRWKNSGTSWVCPSLGIHTRTGKIGTASGVGGVWSSRSMRGI